MENDLLSSAVLSVFVPLLSFSSKSQTPTQIAQKISESNPNCSSYIYKSSSSSTASLPPQPTVKARTSAFYDENLKYYVQLDLNNCPKISDKDLKGFISSLKVVVDVKVVGSVTISLPDAPSDRQGFQQRLINQDQSFDLYTHALDTSDLIYQGPQFGSSANKSASNLGTVQEESENLEEPKEYEEEDDEEENNYRYTAIWAVSTPITHPRVRLFQPKAAINATASLSSSTSVDVGSSDQINTLKHAVSTQNLKQGNNSSRNNSISNGHRQEGTEIAIKYLDEFQPVEDINLFGPLYNDQNLRPIRTKLSVTRLLTSPLPSQDPRSGVTSPTQGPVDGHTNHKPSIDAASQNPQSPLTKPEALPLNSNDNNTATSASSSSMSTLTASLMLSLSPAVNLRLRCTKATGMQDSIVSILEVENAENYDHNVVIESATFDFTAGSAVEFGQSTSFPLWLSPGESSSFAYHLSHPDAGLPQTRVKPITIILKTIPVLGDIDQDYLENQKDVEYSSVVGPQIVTQWDTNVDFGVAVPPNPGSMAAAPPVSIGSASGGVKKLFKVNRSNSVASLKSMASANGQQLASSDQATSSSGTATTTGGVGLSSNSTNNTSASVATNSSVASVGTTSTSTSRLNGLILSFSAPSAVKVGEVFSWKVFAINRSFSNRHLTLYIQPKERPEKTLSDRTSLIPVLDSSTLHKLYEETIIGACTAGNGYGGSTGMGIVSLMNDVRIGPLGPQACYETEIKMLALAPGQATLEGLAVVDLSTGDSYDCGKLLDVIVSN